MDRKLLKAALGGNVTLLQQLLEQDPNILDGNMLDAAAQHRHFGYNREILIEEPELSVPKVIPKENPLHIAAQFGHVDFTREILSRKPHFARELNWQGQSPLHLASAKGHVEVVEVLLENNADACLDRDFKGRTPLHLAAMKGRVQLLEVLLNVEHMAAYVLTKEGDPILHLCANHNQFKSLKKLIELENSHEFINLRDADDNTILHLVVAKQETEVIRQLVSKGGLDINAKNVYGSTALDVSEENTGEFCSWVTMWILLRAGAEIKRKRVSDQPYNTRPRMVTENNKSTEGLLVLAALIASVSFQAAINPPGGVWQETGVHNKTTTFPNGTRSYDPLNPVLHYAGESVMAYTDIESYQSFLLSNTLTLGSSLVVIGIIVSGLEGKFLCKMILVLVTFLSVQLLLASYSTAMDMVLIPTNKGPTNVRNATLTATIFLFCGYLHCQVISPMGLRLPFLLYLRRLRLYTQGV